MTGRPVASTIHAGCPSCSVPFASPSCTQWWTVCPWLTMRSAGSSSAASSADACPISWSSSHSSPAVVGPSEACSRARTSSGHGRSI